MPTYIRDGSWRLVKDIFIRIGSAWRTVNSGWVWNGSVWKLVHSAVQTPYPTGDIVIRDYLDTNIIDNDIYISNTGDTIYGRRGPTWENSPTAFQYRWRYSYISGGPYQDFSPAETTTSHPSPLNTASPISRINDWNDRWIVYQVRAQNSFGWSDWFTSVNEAHLVKYPPVNVSVSITGTPAPNSTLTAVSTWSNTFLNTNDQSPDPSLYLYEWYDNTTNELIYTDTVNTFVPSQSDVGRYVRVTVTATNTGGSTEATSAAVGPIVASPGPFNTISVTKGLSNGSTRPVTVTWEQSPNATAYEVQIQRQYSDLSGWVTVQTFDASPYTFEPTRTATFNVSPVAKYYRVAIRATKSGNVATAAYSDGGTSTSLVYAEALGTAPGAPTSVAASSITATTAIITFNAPSSVGSAAIASYEWSTNNLLWTNTGSTSTSIYVDGLNSATNYTIYVRAVNGDDLAGNANTVTFITSSAPGPFNITSMTKGLYNASLTKSNGTGNGSGTGARPLVINWSQSTNADRYEVQIEARDYDPIVFPDASQTWIVLRTLNEAPYINEPTRTETFNAAFYWQYRATVRARSGIDLASAAYSNGGTSTSYQYFTATGTAPQAVTVGTATSITSTTASVPYTLPSNTGSATIWKTEYSLNLSTWTETSSSPVNLTGLTASTNYVLYMRTTNYDGLTSSISNSPTFTTSAAAPVNISAPGISTNTGNYSAGSVITGTTGSWSGASSYLVEIAYSTSTPVPTTAGTRTNVYTITNTDASNPSYYFATKVTAYAGLNQTGASTVAFSSTSARSTITPTVTTPTVGSATSTGFTVSWTGGPSGYFTSAVLIYNSSQSLIASFPAVTSPYTWTGGSGNTTYYAKVRVNSIDTSSTEVISSFSSAITTLTPFVTPSAGAPALQFSRKTTSPTHLQWYCDYPSTSGSVQSITGMQFEIRTTAGGGTLLASGTRAYPGAGVYPYSAGGTVWAFRMGTTDGDITYNTAARYGRARVVMLGTNGTTYYGTWTGWI